MLYLKRKEIITSILILYIIYWRKLNLPIRFKVKRKKILYLNLLLSSFQYEYFWFKTKKNYKMLSHQFYKHNLNSFSTAYIRNFLTIYNKIFAFF